MQNYSIMIVDDEVNIINSLIRLFRTEGYTIFSAQDGFAALDIMSSNKVDLVIADYRMYRMTGIELLKEVKRIYPDVIRIILTGYVDVDIIMTAINEAGVYRFVTKPWDSNELLINIRRALDYYGLLMDMKSLLRTVRNYVTAVLDKMDGQEYIIKETIKKAGNNASFVSGRHIGPILEEFARKYLPDG